jgi:hypothetical protein
MKKSLILCCTFALFYAGLCAQANLQPPPQLQTAMLRLAPMEGNWKGEGWIQIGQNRHNFIQEEVISLKANKTVVEVEGLGKDKISGETVHQAFAVISFDADNGAYQMMAVRADGKVLNPTIAYNDAGNLEWGFNVQNGGKVKFTIEIRNGAWKESGMFSMDGTKWMPFLEMELKKQ